MPPISAADLALFTEAWLALAAASLKLRFLPFERVMRAPRIGFLRPVADAELARLVWAVGSAQRRIWLRAMCIEAALALRTLLMRRGVAAKLHYGVRSAQGEGLDAHVWLSVDDQVVMGGEAAGQFTEVTSFPPPASA